MTANDSSAPGIPATGERVPCEHEWLFDTLVYETHINIGVTGYHGKPSVPKLVAREYVCVKCGAIKHETEGKE